MGTPTVPWKLILKPPPRLYSTDHGVEATASFLIAYSDAHTFYNDVMGIRSAYAPDGSILSTAPWSYPPEPRIYATSCAIEPLTIDGSPSPGANKGLSPGEFFTLAKADVVFGTRRLGDAINPAIDDPLALMQFDPENPITWCYQDMSISGESTQVDDGIYVWEDDLAPVGFRVQKRTVLCDLTLRFPQVPFLPFKRVQEFADTVNSVRCLYCDPGTLLFLGADTSSELTAIGHRSKSVVLKFRWRKRLWNKMLKRDGTEQYVKDPENNRLYPTKDHRLLFL